MRSKDDKTKNSFLKLESQGRISVKEIDGENEHSSKLLTILQHLKKSS